MKSSFKSRVLRSALLSAFAFGAAVAGNVYAAATATSSMAVSATVSANCSISAGNLVFGAYDPVAVNASAAKTGTGTVTVTCTSGAGATVTLGEGANADTGSTGALPLRRLNDGGLNYLSYALYQDNTASPAIWGNTAATGVAHTGTGMATNLTVYGEITGGQNVPAGNYTDTVVATVTF